MSIEFDQAEDYESILGREKKKFDYYIKWHYGDSGSLSYSHFHGYTQTVGELQKFSQQFQYRKQLMARLFDEALPFIASETRYGLALNKKEQINRIREIFKNEAHDYWIFKKLIQLKNWDYPGFLHVIDLYILANLYWQKANMKNDEEFLKAALVLNLGMLYIPKDILRKNIPSEEEKNILEHHSLWSMEIIKNKMSWKVRRILSNHCKLLFELPVKEESKEVLLCSKILTVLDQYSKLTLLGKGETVYSASDALSLLLPSCKQMKAMSIVRQLMEMAHIYPEGVIVELSNGPRVLIQKTKQEVPFLPRVKECDSGKEYDLPPDQSIMVNNLYKQETEEMFTYYELSEDLTRYAYQLFGQKCKGKNVEEVYTEVVWPSLQELLRKKRSPVLIEKLFLKWIWEEYSATNERYISKI